MPVSADCSCPTTKHNLSGAEWDNHFSSSIPSCTPRRVTWLFSPCAYRKWKTVLYSDWPKPFAYYPANHFDKDLKSLNSSVWNCLSAIPCPIICLSLVNGNTSTSNSVIITFTPRPHTHRWLVLCMMFFDNSNPNGLVFPLRQCGCLLFATSLRA